MLYNKERRCTNLLCEYWENLRGNRLYPDTSEIEPEQLSNIWDYCFIVKYASDQYIIQHVGNAIIQAYENDLNIADAPIIQFDNVDNIQYFLDEVVESKEPLVEQSEWCNPEENEVVKFRQCFLPLGPDENTVKAIIGAIRYKRYLR